MPVIIKNSDRIELVDPISGKNKSIIIDAENQKLIVETDGQVWDISGDTDETVAALAQALHQLETTVEGLIESIGKIGSLDALTTDAKASLVAAVNEVDSHCDANASDIASLATDVGNRSDLETDVTTSVVAALNDTFSQAVIARSHANTNSSDMTSVITQVNTYVNNQLLPTVNSTLIARGTTAAVSASDWTQPSVVPNPSYPYALSLATGFGADDVFDNPADLDASARVMFNPLDLPNDALASFCECNYNVANSEWELTVYASEALVLNPISWELVIARSSTASEVPSAAIAKPQHS